MPDVDVVLPKWGMTMQDATIVEWLVAEGDRVAADQPICVIETDKVNAEVVAPGGGRRRRAAGRPRGRRRGGPAADDHRGRWLTCWRAAGR